MNPLLMFAVRLLGDAVDLCVHSLPVTLFYSVLFVACGDVIQRTSLSRVSYSPM